MIATSEAIRLAERARSIADQVKDQRIASDLELIADAIMTLLSERVWQPINTATKLDEILIGAEGESPTVAIWLNPAGKPEGWYSPSYHAKGPIGPLRPTHWRRIPSW